MSKVFPRSRRKICAPPTELGYRVKLLGVAVRTAKGIEQRVHPTMVPKSSSIAQVMGVTNAVTIDGEGIPPITLVGPGAGGAATASAVVADIADVARGIRANAVRPAGGAAARDRKGADGASRGRLLYPPDGARSAPAPPRPSPPGSPSRRFPSNRSCSAMPTALTPTASAGKASPVPVILITYATSEDAVYRALKAVQRDKVISGRPQVIRIEKN